MLANKLLQSEALPWKSGYKFAPCMFDAGGKHTQGPFCFKKNSNFRNDYIWDKTSNKAGIYGIIKKNTCKHYCVIRSYCSKAISFISNII